MATSRIPQDQSARTLQRFMQKIRYTAYGCWEWTASRHQWGYGYFFFEGKVTVAHRASYQLFVGPIPEGCEIDHLCRNPCCANPNHLEAVPHIVNCQRGVAGAIVAEMSRSKTHCPQGHPYDDENTIHSKSGKRKCRACNKIECSRRNKIRWQMKKAGRLSNMPSNEACPPPKLEPSQPQLLLPL